MLSLKRLLKVICITVAVSCLFFIYNINQNHIRTIEVENQNENQVTREWMSGGTGKETAEIKYYIIGKSSKLQKNVIHTVNSMHLPYVITEQMEESPTDMESVLIFCEDTVSEIMELKALVEYVKAGGKVIFAAGLPEGNVDSYLYPLFGLVEKSIKENYNSLNFKPGFLPFGEGEMYYSGYHASTWISIAAEADIYVEEIQKGVPIVYGYPFEKGKSIILNTDILNDGKCGGLLSASIAMLSEEIVYPILGTENVFLDNFPVVTYVNDAVCMELYGRTTETFVKDIVWPAFQGMAVRNQMKYTTGIMTVCRDSNAFPEIDDELFYTMGKSAIQFEGEVICTGNFDGEGEVVFNTLFDKRFQQIFPQYVLRGFAITNGKPKQEELEEVLKKYPKTKVIRTFMHSDFPDTMTSSFRYTDDYTIVPVMTYGTQLELGNKLEMALLLANYGAVSHGFDINSFIEKDSSGANWDNNQKELENYEKTFFSKLDWLTAVSLSGMDTYVKSYLDLQYSYEVQKDGIKIKAADCYKGQKFYVKSSKEIKETVGADIQKISPAYYVVELQENEAMLYYEEKR